MLYYDRNEFSESIDVSKTSESKECIIFQDWYLDTEFKFQPYVCNRCHYVLIMSVSLGGIAMLNINGVDYSCIFIDITKCEAIKVMKNIKLTEKSGIL